MLFLSIASSKEKYGQCNRAHVIFNRTYLSCQDAIFMEYKVCESSSLERKAVTL